LDHSQLQIWTVSTKTSGYLAGFGSIYESGAPIHLSCCCAAGLHINLSEGVPVSSVQAVSSLLSTDKVFLGKAGIRAALENGALNMDEVYSLIIVKMFLSVDNNVCACAGASS